MEKEDGKKSWDKPWSTSKIREQNEDWSLAGDAGLLQHLQQLSQSLLSRTHSTEVGLDSLLNQLQQGSTGVSNVTNLFLGLANTQFVENRVYDDDEKETPVEEKKQPVVKTKEETDAETIVRIKDALLLGCSVLDKCQSSEAVVKNSTTGKSQSYTVYRRPNPYAVRKLPYLIGSKEFLADPNIGLYKPPSVKKSREDTEEKMSHLKKISEDEITLEDSKRLSIGSRSRLSVGSRSSDTMHGISTNTPKSGQDDLESDDDLFGRASPEEKYENNIFNERNSVGIKEELEKKLSGKDKENVPDVANKDIKHTDVKRSISSIPNSSTEPFLKSMSGDLFAKDVESDDDLLFGSSVSKFSGGQGLFDDMRVTNKTTVTTPVKEEREKRKNSDVPALPTVKPDPLFDNHSEDMRNNLFSPFTSSLGGNEKGLDSDFPPVSSITSESPSNGPDKIFKNAKKLPVKLKLPSSITSENKLIPDNDLFGDDEDDIFSSQKGIIGATKKVSITDNILETEDIFASASPESVNATSSTLIKKMPGAVSAFGSVNPLSVKPRPVRSAMQGVEVTKVHSSPNEHKEAMTAKSNHDINSEQEAQVSNKSSVQKKSNSLLFNNDNEEDDDLFKTTKVITMHGSSELLNKEDDHDSLFSKSSKPAPLFSSGTKQWNNSKRSSGKSSLSLFDESDSGDEMLFSSTSSTSSRSRRSHGSGELLGISSDKKIVQKGSLFDDDLFSESLPENPEFDIFGNSNPKDIKKTVTSVSSSNLFKKKNDDEFDIFADSKITKIDSPKSLFVEDESLFEDIFADSFAIGKPETTNSGNYSSIFSKNKIVSENIPNKINDSACLESIHKSETSAVNINTTESEPTNYSPDSDIFVIESKENKIVESVTKHATEHTAINVVENEIHYTEEGKSLPATTASDISVLQKTLPKYEDSSKLHTDNATSSKKPVVPAKPVPPKTLKINKNIADAHFSSSNEDLFIESSKILSGKEDITNNYSDKNSNKSSHMLDVSSNNEDKINNIFEKNYDELKKSPVKGNAVQDEIDFAMPKTKIRNSIMKDELMINPQALLPGKTYTSRNLNAEVSVSFDEPVSTHTILHNTGKGRAKISAKRRPPTRRARREAAEGSLTNNLDFDVSALHFSKVSTNVHKKEYSSFSPDSSEDNDIFVHSSAAAQPLNTRDKKYKADSSKFSALSQDAHDNSNPLSPSTDEDDLFGIPTDFPPEYGTDFTGDSSGASIFVSAPLLSPVEFNDNDSFSRKKSIFYESLPSDISVSNKNEDIFGEEEIGIPEKKNVTSLYKSAGNSDENNALFNNVEAEPSKSSNTENTVLNDPLSTYNLQCSNNIRDEEPLFTSQKYVSKQKSQFLSSTGVASGDSFPNLFGDNRTVRSLEKTGEFSSATRTDTLVANVSPDKHSKIFIASEKKRESYENSSKELFSSSSMPKSIKPETITDGMLSLQGDLFAPEKQSSNWISDDEDSLFSSSKKSVINSESHILSKHNTSSGNKPTLPNINADIFSTQSQHSIDIDVSIGNNSVSKSKSVPSEHNDIFRDANEGDDLFTSTLPSLKTKVSCDTKLSKSVSRSLFDDDDDDDSIFGSTNTSNKQKESKRLLKHKEPTDSLFKKSGQNKKASLETKADKTKMEHSEIFEDPLSMTKMQ